MKIYLDNCCLQRPLDTRSHPRITLEAEAMLSAMDLCESGQVELISSEVLLFEINRIPNVTRREYVLALVSKASSYASTVEEVTRMARTFIEAKIKPLDALHLASAVDARADLFCTCDDKFLKRAKKVDTLETKVVSPLELITEIEK